MTVLPVKRVVVNTAKSIRTVMTRQEDNPSVRKFGLIDEVSGVGLVYLLNEENVRIIEDWALNLRESL